MRIKRGTTHVRRREALLKRAKGYRWGRKNKIKLARVAVIHAGVQAYTHRRLRKRDFRRLWQIKINAASRLNGLPYSRFIHALKVAKIDLDRKILADLAEHYPTVFAEVVKTAGTNAK